MVDGKTLTVFPDGVETSREPAYRFSTAIGGAMLIEPMPAETPISAAWDSRPVGFDPYKGR